MPPEIQSSETQPDKGMNTKKYLIAVFAFLIASCFVIFAWVHHAARIHAEPNVDTRTHAGDGATATDKGGK